MKRVFKSCLTVAIAAAMVGLAVTQARADTITLTGACASLSCNPESLTVRGKSVSLGASDFTVGIVAANSAALEFASDVLDANDLGVAWAAAQKVTKAADAQLGIKNSARPKSTAVTPQNNFTWWSFSGTRSAMNAAQSSASLALPIGNGRSGSFSVVAGNVANALSLPSASAKTGKTFQANGIASGADTAPNQVTAPAVPEPTTLLLFGTGLVGAAALLRKRLRGRRPDSK